MDSASIHSILSILWNIGSLIILLSVVVAIHEGGHFWVARKLGVKVLRFSLGFGKTLYKKVGKDGVEYVIAAIPLGGYVKMLDEREAEVDQSQLQFAFNRASVGKRIAIVAAGPLANFLLAIFLFWVGFMAGVPGIKPVIGQVVTNSVAEKAGLRTGQTIVSIGDEKVMTWSQVGLALADYLGELTDIQIVVKNTGSYQVETKQLQLVKKIGEIEGETPLETLGINVYLPQLNLDVGAVSDKSPASKAGMLKNDVIKTFNGQKITTWSELLKLLEKKAGQNIELTVLRRGQLIQLNVILGVAPNNSRKMGYLGIRPKADEKYLNELKALRTVVQYGPIDALEQAIIKTGKFFILSINSVKKILTRDVSAKNLSGPVGIAKSAGQSASAGFSQFLLFMGMISVSIGFLNLLPIPVLDGGHLPKAARCG